MADMEETKDILGHLFKLKISKPRSASKYDSWRGLDLDKLSSFPATPAGLQALRDFIVETADKIDRDADQGYKVGGGWLKVKPHFSRDEEKKVVKCSLRCDCYKHVGRHGATITRAEASRLRQDDRVAPIAPDETRECDFWVSKSNLHQLGDDYFVPEWMVNNALEEFRAYSKSRRDVHRFPAVRAVWPQNLKEEWIKAHVGQLPSEEELLLAVTEKEQKQAAYELSIKVKQEAEARKLEEKKESSRKELAQNIKKWEKEKRPSKKGVSIELVDIARESLFRRTGQTQMVLEGVDIYYTTARVNVVVDGRWFTLGIKNIRVLEAIEEVIKTDAPYGLKEDGTLRLQKPGPGRPRQLSEEEAQQRRVQCKTLWNEINRDKMKESQRKWREKKKAEK